MIVEWVCIGLICVTMGTYLVFVIINVCKAYKREKFDKIVTASKKDDSKWPGEK